MIKKVLVAGAGDPVGRRITVDFKKMGLSVAAAIFPGQMESPLDPDLVISMDPTDEANIKNVAKDLQSQWESVDMLVVNVDGTTSDDPKTILDVPDYEKLKWAYTYNALGPLKIIEAFLPLLQNGEGKRICLVTTTDSSNNLTRDTGNFARHISKAPLNMAMNQLFNKYRPDGFTFRIYCKNLEAVPEKCGEFAAEYFIRNRSNEPESYKHSDENRLVMRDWMNIEIPW